MSKNRYGVDVTYFRRWFDRSLQNLADYKPDELARELARMSRTADGKVLLEREFNGRESLNDNEAKIIADILEKGMLSQFSDMGLAPTDGDPFVCYEVNGGEIKFLSAFWDKNLQAFSLTNGLEVDPFDFDPEGWTR